MQEKNLCYRLTAFSTLRIVLFYIRLRCPRVKITVRMNSFILTVNQLAVDYLLLGKKIQAKRNAAYLTGDLVDVVERLTPANKKILLEISESLLRNQGVYGA